MGARCVLVQEKSVVRQLEAPMGAIDLIGVTNPSVTIFCPRTFILIDRFHPKSRLQCGGPDFESNVTCHFNFMSGFSGVRLID